MEINSISDFRKAVRLGPYAWPGGYPLYWIMSDGEAIKWSVCKNERRNMLEALARKDQSGWRPIAFDINYEDNDLYCAHTGDKIESAYGD